MQATIWAQQINLPTGFCYNCGAPSSERWSITTEGGIAAHVTPSDVALDLLVAGAQAGAPREITYCEQCLPLARNAPPAVWTRASLYAPVWLGLAGLAIAFDGGLRTVFLLALVGSVVAYMVWVRHVRSPADPPQTSRYRAFAILNEGKDILRGNRSFVRVEYSNPQVLEEIRRLNPGISITQ